MRPGFKIRLGFLPQDMEYEQPIWIHSVSVGETLSIKHLIEVLREELPKQSFIISTITSTGNKIAKSIATDRDFVTYLPLDLSFIVKKVIDRVNPLIFIIAETEIWPNLIYYLSKKNIPVIVVNARISDNSFKGYLMIRFLLSRLLNRINTFCVQTSQDAERLSALGVIPDKIKFSGNMKFDIKVKDDRELKKDWTDYRLRFGLLPPDKLFIAASTHQGEEESILDVYKQLQKDNANIKLLIAPRHPERAKEVARIVIKKGFNPARISQFVSKPFEQLVSFNQQTSQLANQRINRQRDRQTASSVGLQTVFILDTVGQLMYFYTISDIVFVGGSLVRKGGHNILEPAALSKPMLFGPHMFNFSDITRLFLKANAAIMVRNTKELKTNIRDLLSNESKMVELGKRSREIILKNQGATLRNKEIIMELVSKSTN